MTKKKSTKKKKTTKKATKNEQVTRPRSSSNGKKRVELKFDSPDAIAVVVTGSFCGWDDGVQLKKDPSGLWKTTLTLPSGRYEYRFRVDGEWRDDPRCSEKIPNRFGTVNCILHV